MAKRDNAESTDPTEIASLRERLRNGKLGEGDLVVLDRLLGLLLTLISVVQEKNYSIKRLKRLLFGPGTDTRSTKGAAADGEGGTPDSSSGDAASSPSQKRSERPKLEGKRRGHGRLAASRFVGAHKVRCETAALHPKAPCPDPCCRGHLYDTKRPQFFIRRTGQPIVLATQYEQPVYRCSACQTRDATPLPEGVPRQAWDATASVAIGLYKYAGGVPWYRFSQLQASFGLPVPISTAFERCELVADAVSPVYRLLREMAAGGELFYVDDTTARILSCMAEKKKAAEGERTGQYTTGIVADVGARRIVVYTTSRSYAGENLDDLLSQRPVGLDLPQQMSDALSRNWPTQFTTIILKCLAHARREFVLLEDAFPAACGRVLDDLAAVYHHDAICRERGLVGEARLAFHQQHSGPVLEALRIWIDEWLDERRVEEPNGRLGKALGYLRRHWMGLTQFLRVSDAPLDNNVCEQALKRAVLLRKNARFFKTEHGAAIGDMWLSVIETCRHNGVNPFEYLVAVVRNAAAARARPRAWLPWNYTEAELEAREAA